MIGIGPDSANGLFEGEFDFETQAVEANDFRSCETQVGRHQKNSSTGGMLYGHKTDDNSDGTPEQVEALKLEGNAGLRIDGAEALLHPLGLVEERTQFDFSSVFARAPARFGTGGFGD